MGCTLIRKGTVGLAALLAAATVAGGAVVATGVSVAGAAYAGPGATATTGYYEVAADGGVFTYGTAQYYGSMGGQHLDSPIVGLATTTDGKGYWLVAADGGVFSFGDAQYYGSMGGQHLNSPIVGIAAYPGSQGYYLVAADGGVFTFGQAQFFGSLGGTHLNAPIVGIDATADGGGYYLSAADGGVFTFGDAYFWGSAVCTGSTCAPHTAAVGMATNNSASGGYVVAMSNGETAYLGKASSGAGTPIPGLVKPIVGIAAPATTTGYWLVAADGGIFTYGSAQFYGSAGGLKLVAPIVGIAAD